MWRILGNIVEMFVYASVYMIIAIIAVKIVAASLPYDTERRASEITGSSLVFAAVFIGLALLLSAVIK
jgi:hypothetical protein